MDGILRWAVFVPIFCVALTGAAMNGWYGSTLGQGVAAAAILASGFVSLDVTKWFLAVLAQSAWREGRVAASVAAVVLLVVLMGVSLTAAIGFSVQNRGDANAARVTTQFDQADARRTIDGLQAALDEMRTSRRFASSDGCANATVARSISFCAEYDRVRNALADTRARLVDRPAVGAQDPMLKLLGTWEAFGDQALALILVSLFFALAFELTGSLGWWIVGARRDTSVDTRMNAAEMTEAGVANLPGIRDLILFRQECLKRSYFSSGIPADDLYAVYRRWAEGRGTYAVPQVAFNMMMDKVIRHTPGPNGGHFKGWSIVHSPAVKRVA